MPLVSKLHVVITADGVQRTFESEGDGWVVVAAFRSWLTSPDCQLPMAEGADEIDLPDNEVAPARVAEQAPTQSASRFFKTSSLSAAALKEAPQPKQPKKPLEEYTLADKLMDEAFFVGSDKYTFQRLCSFVASSPKYTTQDLKQALQRLVFTKRIAVRTVGNQQEYWRIPPSSVAMEEAR